MYFRPMKWIRILSEMLVSLKIVPDLFYSNIRDGINLITRTLRISADLSTSGLYVAFKDRGTCIGKGGGGGES